MNGAPGQASIHPLDAELCLPARSFSYEVQRHLARAAVCGPFDEAVRVVAELTGVSIPKRSAEQIVLDAACDVDSFYERRSGTKPQPGELLVGAIDGKGIPMKKPTPARRVVRRKEGEKPNKKRVTVAAVFAAAPRKRTPASVVESLFQEDPQPSGRRHRREQRPKDKWAWASSLACKDSFIADVGAEMARRDPSHERTWVIVTDGERALQRRVISSFPTVTLVLDIFHANARQRARGEVRPVGGGRHGPGRPDREAPGCGRGSFELAVGLDWERSRALHRITRMASRGLVREERCSSDRRGAVVVVTDAGRRAIESAAPGHVRAVRQLFIDPLTDE